MRRSIVAVLSAALLGALLPTVDPSPVAAAPVAPAQASGSQGDLIAYVCLVDSKSQICTIDPDDPSATPIRVTNLSDGGAFAPTWSPDGTELAFSVGRGLTVDPGNHVYAVRIDEHGRAAGSIRAVSRGSLPAWGPTMSGHTRLKSTPRVVGQVLRHDWDFGNNRTLFGKEVEVDLADGDHAVELKVTDENNRTSTARTTISRPTKGRPPVADFDYTPTPTSEAPYAVRFTASPSEEFTSGATAPDPQTSWSFGNGMTADVSEGEAVTVPYAEPKTYEVTMTYRGRNGIVSSITRSVDVGLASPLPQAPAARMEVESRGGSIAVVEASDDSTSWIRNYNLDGTNRDSVLSPHEHEHNPTDILEWPEWVGDSGDVLAYSRRFGNSSTRNQSDIYVNGSNATHRWVDLGQRVGQMMPAVTRDGSRIAYVACSDSLSNGMCVFDRTVIEVGALVEQGGEWKITDTRVIANRDTAYKLDPAWSPDGTRVAYADFARGIVITDVDAPDPSAAEFVIAGTTRRERAPAWRPPVVSDQAPALRAVTEAAPHTASTTFNRSQRIAAELIHPPVDAVGSLTVCIVKADEEDRCIQGATVPSGDLPMVIVFGDPTEPGSQVGPGRWRLVLRDNTGVRLRSAAFGVLCDDTCPKLAPTTATKALAVTTQRAFAGLCAIALPYFTYRALTANFSSPGGFPTLASLSVKLAVAGIVTGVASTALPDSGLDDAVLSLDKATLIAGAALTGMMGLLGALSFGQFAAEAGLVTMSVLCSANQRFWQGIADDPPDPDYTQVQEVDLSQVGAAVDGPVGRLSTDLEMGAHHLSSLLVSLERAQGAEAAGDAESTVRQVTQMQQSAEALADLYDSVADELEAASVEARGTPLGSSPLFSADGLSESASIRSTVGDPFTPEARQSLIDAGWTEGEIDGYIAEMTTASHDPALSSTSGAAMLAAAAQDARDASANADKVASEAAAARAGILPAPFVDDSALEVGRNTSAPVQLDAFDPYSNVVSFEILTQPLHGSLTGQAPNLVYTPEPGYLGPDSFTWRASNSMAASPPATVSIEVLLPAPEAFADEYGTNVSTTLEVPAPGVLTNDLALALPMTAELERRPAQGSVALRPDGSFTYTPRSTASGTDRFTYRARTPGSAASEPVTVTIQLVDANRPPTAVSDLLRIDEDGAGSIDVLANDVDLDGDPLVVTGIRQPRYGTVVCVGSVCTYSPPADFHGVDQLTYTVSDGQGATSTGYVRVEVAPVEDPPRAVDDLVSIEPGMPVVVDVLANDSDPDGDVISFVSNTQPANGSAACTAEGTCTYTPNDVDVSADAFEYTIRDANGNEAQAQVLVANEPPMIFSEGPLELIITGNTLSCSVDYAGDLLGSFFNDVGCGTFLASNGTLHGQSFTGVGLNPPQPRELYEPLSQSRVLGSGTVDDPYHVTTRVRAGDSGLEITQVDSYVVGEESYRTDVTVENTGATEAPVVLYRGGDCQLGDSDTGFGRIDPDTGAVACTAADGRILEWLPLTGGSTSIETDPDSFWDAIASQQPFPGTCRCDEDIDNAGGLSWAFTVAPGSAVTQSHRTIFSPFGYRPLTTSMATATPSVAPLADVSYEVTVTNPNTTTPAVLDDITAQLPIGFVARPGTTTGATTADPSAVGRRLTWTGPFTIPAGDTVTLAFGASAIDVPGTYLASATATAASFSVQGSGDSAAVEVLDAIAPVALFSSTGPELAIDFDGTASFDIDGTVERWSWDFGDGATGTGATTSHAYAAAGTYTVGLTVTDDDGATSTTSQQVVARDPNQLPTALIDATTDELRIALDGTSSTDPDGTIVSYQWDLGDGSSAWGPTPQHQYAAPGPYTVQLTVTDDRGGTGTTTATLEVTQRANVPPIAAFTTSPAGLTVGFDGRSSNDPDEPDGRVASYAWDFGDGSGDTGEQPSHAYAADGTYPVTLTVTDRRGATASTTRDVVVSESRMSNAPPLAAFSPVVDGLTVDVDGSPSADPDGEIVAYEWQFADQGYDEGPDATFAFLDAGTYPVRLVVTDDDGASSATVLSVSVPSGDTNAVPTATFTSVVDGLGVDLDGTGSSDPDGTIESWSWDFGDGTSGSGATPTHTYATGGTYEVTLTVTDDAGATDTDTQPVTVTAPPPPNQPPVAAFTWTADELAVDLDGATSSDPDGTVESWSWDFGDGGTATGSTAGHTYAAPGTYEVVLTVTDDDGATDQHAQDVSVSVVDPPPPPNLPPVAAFSVDVTGRDVAFDASSAADPDGTVVAYDWDLGDGSTATGPAPEHTYAADGTYQVTLTVTDDDGATGTTTVPVTVSEPRGGEPPVAAFTAATTGLGVDLDGSTSSDPDGTIASYAWDFGDGTVGSGTTPAHAYAAGGTYQVTLTVTDDDGQTDSATVPVTVWGPAAPTSAPPIADVVLDVEGLAVDLDGAPSFDPDGTVVTWSWDLGDGTTSSGTTVAHTYASAGTYDVTLVVTDDDGSTGTTTRRVVAVGPAGPAAPVAAFTYAVDGGRLTVDGSESADPDGGIVSWRWSFGDDPASEVSGPGAVAGHVYARSGTYPVTLVVVAADGAEATTLQDVTVAVAGSPAPVTPAAPAAPAPVVPSVGGDQATAPTSSAVGTPLPRTGSEPLPLARFALVTLLLGLFALAGGRHRARRHGAR